MKTKTRDLHRSNQTHRRLGGFRFLRMSAFGRKLLYAEMKLLVPLIADKRLFAWSFNRFSRTMKFGVIKTGDWQV